MKEAKTLSHLPVVESTGMTDTAHLAIFIFHVGDFNLHIMEEILAFKINAWGKRDENI